MCNGVRTSVERSRGWRAIKVDRGNLPHSTTTARQADSSPVPALSRGATYPTVGYFSLSPPHHNEEQELNSGPRKLHPYTLLAQWYHPTTLLPGAQDGTHTSPFLSLILTRALWNRWKWMTRQDHPVSFTSGSIHCPHVFSSFLCPTGVLPTRCVLVHRVHRVPRMKGVICPPKSFPQPETPPWGILHVAHWCISASPTGQTMAHRGSSMPRKMAW